MLSAIFPFISRDVESLFWTGFMVVYYSYMFRTRHVKFDVYRRTAELEYELDILPHADDRVREACTFDHSQDDKKEKNEESAKMLKAAMATQNELREMAKKEKESREKEKSKLEKIMALPREDLESLFPDADVVYADNQPIRILRKDSMGRPYRDPYEEVIEALLSYSRDEDEV